MRLVSLVLISLLVACGNPKKPISYTDVSTDNSSYLRCLELKEPEVTGEIEQDKQAKQAFEKALGDVNFITRDICKASVLAYSRLDSYWGTTDDYYNIGGAVDGTLIFSTLTAAGAVLFGSHIDVIKTAGLVGLTAGSYKSYTSFDAQQPIYENAIRSTQCVASTGRKIALEVKESWAKFDQVYLDGKSDSETMIKLSRFVEDQKAKYSADPEDNAAKIFIEKYTETNSQLDKIIGSVIKTRVDVKQVSYTIESLLTDIELTLRKEIRGVRPDVNDIIEKINNHNKEKNENEKNQTNAPQLILKPASSGNKVDGLSKEELLANFQYNVALLYKFDERYRANLINLQVCTIGQ